MAFFATARSEEGDMFKTPLPADHDVLLVANIRSSRESLKRRNSSFLGQDRVDNLMKDHS